LINEEWIKCLTSPLDTASPPDRETVQLPRSLCSLPPLVVRYYNSGPHMKS